MTGLKQIWDSGTFLFSSGKATEKNKIKKLEN